MPVLHCLHARIQYRDVVWSCFVLRPEPESRVSQNRRCARIAARSADRRFDFNRISEAVRTKLKGKANVHRIPTNGATSAVGGVNIDDWLGSLKWEVIH